jgi:hypothetical protein
VVGSSFPLARSVRQGCPLAPYLFILATDILGHMLEDQRFGVKGLSLSRGGHILEQTFADDTALFLQGSRANMDKAQEVLNTFCKASGAKINWKKTAAIWANKRTRTWEWGQEVRLQWVQEGKGVRYLGIQVGFRLPPEVNFDKMLSNLKNKLINWSTCHLSLAGRILVANQMLLVSMWYLAASWNPNPRMCSQVRGVVRNFIWGGKATTTRAKVKWDTFILPTSKGGFGIIDPKTQSEALLAKLLIRGLAPRGEPWKELLRHKADAVKLPIHSLGPSTQDIHWIFSAPKLKRPPCSLWKSILRAWMSVKQGLSKSKPTNPAEWLRQPVFANPTITNSAHRLLDLNGKSEGNAFASVGCSRIKDFWDQETHEWKSLPAMGVSSHTINRQNKEIITSSIPWNRAAAEFRPLAGDWVSKREAPRNTPLNWAYQVVETLQTTARAREYKRTSPAGRIQPTSAQEITVPLAGYEPIRVLAQENHGSTLKIAKDLPKPGKKPLILWIFEEGFVIDLRWDPREWH